MLICIIYENFMQKLYYENKRLQVLVIFEIPFWCCNYLHSFPLVASFGVMS